MISKVLVVLTVSKDFPSGVLGAKWRHEVRGWATSLALEGAQFIPRVPADGPLLWEAGSGANLESIFCGGSCGLLEWLLQKVQSQ